MVEAAAREPVLRRLHPILDHGALCFSRCTGEPSAVVGPWISLSARGVYQVGLHSVVAETGSAEEAVREVVSQMPPGIGPAIQGTAADLD